MRKVDPIKQQERRRHILNAAAHCFAEHGFHGTSTAQICERAGMSPATYSTTTAARPISSRP